MCVVCFFCSFISSQVWGYIWDVIHFICSTINDQSVLYEFAFIRIVWDGFGRKDKQQYWNERRATGRNNALRYTKKHQINEVDEANSVNDEDYQYKEENVNTDYEGIEEINFPYSKFTEEEYLTYYNNK